MGVHAELAACGLETSAGSNPLLNEFDSRGRQLSEIKQVRLDRGKPESGCID